MEEFKDNKFEHDIDLIPERDDIQSHKNHFMLLEQNDPIMASGLKADFEQFENALYEMSVEGVSKNMAWTIEELLKKVPDNKWIKYISENGDKMLNDIDWKKTGH